MPLSCLNKPDADIYKVLLKNSLGRVIITNTAGKILWCNDRALEWFSFNHSTKVTLKLALGKLPEEFLPKINQISSTLHEMDKCVLNEEKTLSTTEQYIHFETGKSHLIRVDKIPYKNENGEIAGVVTFVLDMTEALEAHIMKYNNDIVYHKLRSNLGNIISILKDNVPAT